jgi:hypothetical protein
VLFGPGYNGCVAVQALSEAIALRKEQLGPTYRPQPVPVAVNDPPLRIVEVDRCAYVSASNLPIDRGSVVHT